MDEKKVEDTVVISKNEYNRLKLFEIQAEKNKDKLERVFRWIALQSRIFNIDLKDFAENIGVDLGEEMKPFEFSKGEE